MKENLSVGEKRNLSEAKIILRMTRSFKQTRTHFLTSTSAGLSTGMEAGVAQALARGPRGSDWKKPAFVDTKLVWKAQAARSGSGP